MIEPPDASGPESWPAAVRTEQAEHAAALIVDVDGYEGPLDLLLEMARRQRVDLGRISVLALADQYLEFIDRARVLELDLAADYLVMAAWLAFLKSRLLLPVVTPDGVPADAVLAAEALAHQLQRLDAMRRAAANLQHRPRLHHDVFLRGRPSGAATPVGAEMPAAWQASLHELLVGYARQRQKQAGASVTIAAREVCSLSDARDALEQAMPAAHAEGPGQWFALDDMPGRGPARRSLRASAFAVLLELARDGRADLRQDEAFAPLFLRWRPMVKRDEEDPDLKATSR